MYTSTDMIAWGLFSSLLSSLITLIVKYLLEHFGARIAYKRDLRKQVFLRKTDAVERAMAWCQSAVDIYSLFRMTVYKYDLAVDPTIIEYFGVKFNILFQETLTKLNPIYLYYDFTDIEVKCRVTESLQIINREFEQIVQIQQHISTIPTTNDEETENKLYLEKLRHSIDIIVSAMDNQRVAIMEIQQRLKDEYRKYMKI